MILAFEMMWPGLIHAPGNSATLQTVAAAFPREQVRVFAEAGHIGELRRDAALTANANVSFHPVPFYPHLFGKMQIVSWGRFRHELATIRLGLAKLPPGENCLILLISATPTAIVAARLLAQLGRRQIGVQVGLHGNLNDIKGWRPRNPLTRAFDLRSVLSARRVPMVRYLVLEEGIKRALAEELPDIQDRVGVLPLPINPREIPQQQQDAIGSPVRIGLVGQATGAKGIDAFLDMARDLKARHGYRLAFTLVGRAPKDADLAKFDILEHRVTRDLLPREEYLNRLASLHYVFLPLHESYYRLSASGALIDAITWLKPIVATRLPIVESLFRQHGDIGYMCSSVDEMRATVEGLAMAPDGRRYWQQVEALRTLRDSRLPTVLAASYRSMMQRDFPALLRD